MPSVEMLKKLLDEFVEKQALIDEEMKVVADQIQQLEARLQVCRSRVSTMGVDREKVVAMQSRYAAAAADSYQTVSITAPAIKTAATVEETSASASRVQPVSQTSAATRSPAKPAPADSAPQLSNPIPPTSIARMHKPLESTANSAESSPVGSSEASLEPFTEPINSEKNLEQQSVVPEYPAQQNTTVNGLNAILGKRRARGSVVPDSNQIPNQSAPSVPSDVYTDEHASNDIGSTMSDRLADDKQGRPLAQPEDSVPSQGATDPGQFQNASTSELVALPPTVQPSDNDNDAVVDLGNEESGEENDTVKSINDALRTLFR